MSHARYLVGDVFDRMAELPDGSVDLLMTSPPFLSLRSYLPADHPDKAKEVGSEATPAAFIDTLLRLTAEWRRLLAPHGSICVELGDTYARSGGAGGDYAEGGLRADQPKFRQPRDFTGWPLAKSLCAIPQLFEASLAYGRNLLTGTESPAGQWRVRNMVAWCRPNPPVGALGDKFRPATSYLTIACVSDRRYFDLDAVRVPYSEGTLRQYAADGADPLTTQRPTQSQANNPASKGMTEQRLTHAGAPPLDWWNIPTHPYPGAHYATFPPALCVKPILAMTPQRVCTTCGQPSRRIVEEEYLSQRNGGMKDGEVIPEGGWRSGRGGDVEGASSGKLRATKADTTVGWSDCQHGTWRNGLVLDPFAGSGTTLAVASGHGRDSVGIDLDPRGADLARERVGMFLEVEEGPRPPTAKGGKVAGVEPVDVRSDLL